VNTEELTAALVLEGEDDLLVYCMSDSATYIYCMSDSATYICKKRYYGYYSSLIGRYLVESEMKFGEFYRVSRDVFHFILK
jgi:hypothetical protein